MLELLKLMELGGATVTLDAMHCQVETAAAIQQAKADFLLMVKGNQESLYRALLAWFIEYGESDYHVPGLRRHITVEKSHGRKECREIYVIEAPADEPRLSRWPGVRSIGMIYRCREPGEKTHEETMVFITSHPPTVKMPSGFLRAHCGIENRQHWILDITFSKMRVGFEGETHQKSPPPFDAWR